MIMNEHTQQDPPVVLSAAGEGTDSSEKRTVNEDQVKSPSDSNTVFPVQFTGKAGEYFRIWLVNTLLTIMTLGIYAAWAKVRKREYLFAHTVVNDQSLHYLASPVALLKGNLIVAGLVIVYGVISTYFPVYSTAGLFVLYLFLPALIVKSIRFNLRYTDYCNIRFQFHGSIAEGYIVYLLWPLLALVTLGIFAPHMFFRQKQFFFENLGYGSSRVVFTGSNGRFFKVYYIAAFMYVVIFMLMFWLLVSLFMRDVQSAKAFAASQDLSLLPDLFRNLVYVFSVVVFLLPILIGQYIYARIFNYCWSQCEIKSTRFTTQLKARRLAWIRITNILAIIFSLGLAFPWTRIRRIRYVSEQVTVLSEHGLERFQGADTKEQSAVSESAADFFDFEFGL